MNVSESPFFPPVDQNSQGARKVHPRQEDHSSYPSAQSWGKYLVKEVSQGREQDDLAVGSMPHPSAINEHPMEWSSVQACPASTPDLPQGNLDHELKEFLKRFAECMSKGQPLPVSDYKAFIKYFGKLPPNADPDQLDSEDYLLKIKEDPYYIEQVPQEKLTPDLCVQACTKFNYGNLQYVPERIKTDEFYRALALEESNALNYVPEKIKRQWLDDGFFDVLFEKDDDVICYIPRDAKTDAHFEIACRKSPTALSSYPKNKPISDHLLAIAIERFGSLQYCPDHKKTAELCELACRCNGLALKYVPEKLKTAALCQMAVDKNADAFEFIPEAVKTFEMYLAASKSDRVLKKLPEFLTQAQRTEIYRTACTFGITVLNDIPKQFITEEFLKSVFTSKEHVNTPLACAAHIRLSQFVEDDKVFELYSLALSLSPDALEFVPKYIRKGAILHEALKHDVSVLKYVPVENLNFIECCLKASVTKEMMDTSDASLEKCQLRLIKLNKMPYVPTNVQLMFLSNTDSTLKEKLRLIESLDAPSYTFPEQVLAAPLVCQKSPLQFRCTNLFLLPLISTAHQVTGFALPRAGDGENINRYIAGNMPSSFGLQDIPEELCPANGSATRIVGGRTIQCLKAGSQAAYFKFQRAGEPLETLAREGLLYQVIAATPELAFKSELPKYQAFMQLPLGEGLRCLISQFDDRVEIVERHGQQYVNVFSYTAPAAYARYAHSPEADGDCPRERPEQGILKACHDAGYMTSMGLVPTSMLQCLHETDYGRGWVALHAAMNRLHDNIHPGKLAAWNTLATDKIDFGHCGIRDLGDYETFGDIQSCLRQKDTLDHCYPPIVSQRVALANSICEIIVSAVLVRSRLRQRDDGYHYKNPQALKETATFIESACNQFLTGLMPLPATLNHLQSLLGREDQEYREWLGRVAQEVLYWTALQPCESGFDQLTGGEYDPADCYLNHVKNNKRLSETLYSYGAGKLLSEKNFLNIDDQLNLGAYNSTFPLISLMNGLTRMCTGVLEQLNRSGRR
ncbi:DUF4116 domain-containing protein [Endozoicomonas sp. 8E]|uniref:DUF4116 domain-containing protein n=1 Tax=Endozoicomonas sp. 8E TaxID=3035692 RepID=UPI002939453A|nr:DUF4116 domain-containing protein [Endozoicomonas sp. 8E]WOG28352.1 DUF4116 domain-containing protein [Endozoicomonas sp. 8E]